MNNDDLKSLCLTLMDADTEETVIEILAEAGYWEHSDLWRYYGNNENNYSIIGNQQSRPDAALVEKIVNSVDARLMNACLELGGNPEEQDVPQSIRSAVARFFENHESSASYVTGRISEWDDKKRNEVARGITLAATGFGPREGKPCFTISDCGEGQTPEMIPNTLLSLSKSNKLRIPFVQGKFNMGGSGVLRFCGNHHLQLILSRRNPKIVKHAKKHPTDDQWSFTVVRREDPKEGRRSSIYTYLAPLDADVNHGRGRVLRFSSDTMPIFPQGRDPYLRESEWGTLIKLYEYTNKAYSNSHILRRGGIQSRLDILLPDIALPIRLHECRKTYKGHSGSFDNNVNGLIVRLHDDSKDNIEGQWPTDLDVGGERMDARIYVFKKGAASSYKGNEGIIFTLNGQTHGHYTKDFFHRGKVKHSYLRDSILVIVDCSKISGRAREDLFAGSRDRIVGGDLSSKLELALEDLLHNHRGLKELAEKRRREEAASKLKDDKPLEDILKSLLKSSPTLASLFLKGTRISNPVKPKDVASHDVDFKGKKFPSFFKFKGIDYGQVYHKNCPRNSRARIIFETDASNNYFDESRKTDKGEFTLYLSENGEKLPATNYVGPYLHDGIASLSFALPEHIKANDVLRFTTMVNDITRPEPFENIFEITVLGPTEKRRGGEGKSKPPSEDQGHQREIPGGIEMPSIDRVYEADWDKQDPPFDKYTALRIRSTDVTVDEEDSQDNTAYDFKVNMDNIFLKTEQMNAKVEINLIRARFIYGMVLIGLALLQKDERKRRADGVELEGENERENIEDRIEEFTKAIASVLLPMINSLGSLELVDEKLLDATGEAY